VILSAGAGILGAGEVAVREVAIVESSNCDVHDALREELISVLKSLPVWPEDVKFNPVDIQSIQSNNIERQRYSCPQVVTKDRERESGKFFGVSRVAAGGDKPSGNSRVVQQLGFYNIQCYSTKLQWRF